MADDLDLVSKLSIEEKAIREFRLKCISPDDGKYGKAIDTLRDFLSAEAEWRACVSLQGVLLQTRVEFGQAKPKHLIEFGLVLDKIDLLNMALLEEKVTHHDQLAVIEEIGRFVSPETKALLHPGTTSYDILDTARARLLKRVWVEIIRPEIAKSVKKLCDLAEDTKDVIQVGRTHLQNTSPVLFGGVLAGYVARLAERVFRCDMYFNDLRGKISGIVGTGASIDMVVGDGKSMEFEKTVLACLELKPDYTATQITQKERLADVGHGLVSLMHVLGDFTNDMRMLYSSAIGEVSDREASERLGGSSADAGKNNPINWENISGKVAVVESGMRVLYEMIHSDFQRDLRGSVQARYQPNAMIAETYESFVRLNKSLETLSVNENRIAENLNAVRENPTEAMVAILRAEGFVHSKYGVGHEFVKVMGREAKRSGRKLLYVCQEDKEFLEQYKRLTIIKQCILQGRLEDYLGSACERASANISYAKSV
ncbi:MAG: lyase family protein [Nanoarchaeota archaeon]|nr:lyase family protein [Nanoarchaeota archaeon]